jgi:hypothetical protein
MNWIRYLCACLFNKIDDDDDDIDSTVHSDASTYKQFSFQGNPMLRSSLLERD